MPLDSSTKKIYLAKWGIIFIKKRGSLLADDRYREQHETLC